jgi:hypothetical protein
MRLRFPRAAIIVVAVAAVAVPAAVHAQDEEPDAQRVPAPEECQVEPRPVDELIALLGPAGTPPAGEADDTGDAEDAEQSGDATAEAGSGVSAADGVTLPIPLGEPADEETGEAINATARELLACLNAGDLARVSALFTDAAVGPTLGPAPADPSGLEREPEPLEREARSRLIAITDQSLLTDGRAAAFVVLNDPLNLPRGPETYLLIFAEEEGRWLIDGLIDFSVVPDPPRGTPEAEATPAP